MLGKLGSPGSLTELTKALEHPKPKIRVAAAIALGDWPTAEPIIALEAFISREKNPSDRKNAITSLGNLAPLAGSSPQEEIATVLIETYRTTRDSLEQRAILTALSRISEPSAAAFFQEVSAKDHRLKPIADPAVKTINAALAKATTVTGSTVLEPAKADRTPGPLAVDKATGAIINWLGLGDHVSWLVKVEQPGEYEITLSQAYGGANPGRYTVTFSSAFLPKIVEKTSSAADFRSVSAGRASFTKPGHYRLWIRPVFIAKDDQLMRLKEVTLTRSGG